MNIEVRWLSRIACKMKSNWIFATIVAVFASYNRLEQEEQKLEFK